MAFRRKLTPAQVRLVRATDPYHGWISQLARAMGVSHQTIRNVVRGFTYKKVVS